ncbi:MAG TPA: efflux RND transporter permease subunit [Polyangiaceae bacterium]|jgi:Cu(I)/Ag(I) efflux system membrane protein CusA/SilA
MIRGLVDFGTRRSGVVLAVSLVVALVGVAAWRSLGRDAIPDLSNPQIVLVVDWMGHPAEEVAAQVTSVLTRAFDGLPGMAAVRGSSMDGMSYIDVTFDSPSQLELGREAIVQRVAAERARLPPTARLEVGPVASSTGWIFEYVLVDPQRRQSGLALRRFQDEVLRPALASIPGVAEVASVGGALPEVLVELEADRLRGHAVAFSDALATLRAAVDAHAVKQPTDLAALPVSGPDRAAPSGPTLHVGDLGHVHVTDDMPTGLADFRGIQPAVGGIVVARRDADIRAVIAAAESKLDAARPSLPSGVELVVAYDRSDLIARVGRTLLRALGEEVAIVVLVTLVFLLHWRSAIVPLLTLPLVLLTTFGVMWALGVPATIMSLGGVGIALGIAVDADIVALEACHRQLEAAGSAGSRRANLVAAADRFAPAILTSLLITALAFLPVFAFGGESGRLLRPFALTKTLVVAAAAVVSLTLAPALRDRLLVGRVPPEFENPITRVLVRGYRPFVHFALSRPALTIATATLAVLSCVPIASRLGGEFLPHIDEGDLLFMPTTLAGAPPDQAATELFRQDRALRAFREISGVFGKVGRADTATDPAPYSMAETTIRLRPREDWPALPRKRWYSSWAPAPLRRLLGRLWPEATQETPAELVERLDKATRLPGWVSAWTTPARARMDMMATGVRTPVGVRVVASAPARLDALGTELRSVLTRIPGTRGAVSESQGGQPWLDFDPDPAALARLGVDGDLARATAHFIVTGGQIGEMDLDGQRVRVRVAPDENMHAMMMPGPGEPLRGPPDQLREATVRSKSGSPVPLSLLGRVRYVIAPALIRTERGEMVSYVYVDLMDGTDVGGYVHRAMAEVDRAKAAGEIHLDPGERIEWTGQYELMTAGERRFEWIAPVVLLSMLGLLWLQFRNLTEGLIVLAAVPFALVGSLWTLYLLSYPLSAPVWVGLLSTVGLAMQTGVVMVVYIDEAFYRRVQQGTLLTRDDIVAAHAEGTVQRLRPKMMTVTTMAASLLPLLWAQGAGAEILKRVAAPMLGGLATSALLTLEVLPVIYTIWRTAQLRRAERAGVPIEAIVGRMPAWAAGRRDGKKEADVGIVGDVSSSP